MKVKFYLPVLLASAATFAGCMKHAEVPADNDSQNSAYFDFATTNQYTLTVNYNLVSAGYPTGEILFEVYAENPDRIYTDGEGMIATARRTDITPVFKAITSNHGRFSGEMQLPVDVKTIYLCVDHIGLPRVIAAQVTDGVISVNTANTASMAAAAGSRSGANHVYPDDMRPIDDRDDWTALGVPSYLNPGGAPKTLPTGLAKDINAVLPEASKLSEGPHAYLMEPNCRHDIDIIKATTIDMVFVHDGAVLTNTVGYYLYPTNNPPQTPAQIGTKYIAFPNASVTGGYGALNAGDYVHLKYFDNGVWKDEFPAGYSIGFFLLHHGFNGAEGYGNNSSGDIRSVHDSNYPMFFSTAALNYQYLPYDASRIKQQTISLYDYAQDGRNLVVIGFEDMKNGTIPPSGDQDFNDVVFYIQGTPTDGIKVPDDRDKDMDPDPQPDPEEYYIEYFGTLAFEDLWPNKGDYDMNDVGIEYYCQVWRNKDNKVFKVVDQFTPVHKGAEFQNGFGYQYGVAPSAIKSMQWSVSDPTKARPNYVLDAKGLEANQSLATVMLFDNIHNEVEGPNLDYIGGQQSPKYTYTITTEFNSPQEIAAVGFPPYNPFIVVIHTDGGNYVDPRNREVHLPNFAPTDLARGRDGGLWFGHYGDRSNQTATWYVSDAEFPFAINIPTKDFRFPKETVRIDAVYSRFNSWVSSKGAQDADWYK